MKERNEELAKILTVTLNKGGSGKSTTIIVLSQLLSWLGYKVLTVDNDPQANLSMYFGVIQHDTQDMLNGVSLPDERDYNISELYRFRYKTQDEVEKLICSTNVPNVELLPASNRLNNIDSVLKTSPGNNTVILKRALKSISHQYDFILIDNAPANNHLTVNSIIASDYLIMPVEVENFSLKGVKETLITLQYLQEEYDIEAEFLGAFLTKVDMRTTASRDGIELYKESLNGKLFHATVRHDTAIKEAIQKLKPLLKLKKAATCAGLLDYAKLLLEMDILDAEGTERLSSFIG